VGVFVAINFSFYDVEKVLAEVVESI